jgi:hypothetical protein
MGAARVALAVDRVLGPSRDEPASGGRSRDARGGAPGDYEMVDPVALLEPLVRSPAARERRQLVSRRT